jgi:transporter family-2 protein
VGITIAFQQAINGRLNAVAKSPLATTWMNFATGGIVIFVALCFTLLRGGNIGPLPHNFWLYTGGSIGVIYVSISALIIKNLGVLNFILFSVTGQLIGAVLLDWLAPARVGALSGFLITGTLMTLLSITFSRFYEARKA